jgi:hypothetical protein
VRLSGRVTPVTVPAGAHRAPARPLSRFRRLGAELVLGAPRGEAAFGEGLRFSGSLVSPPYRPATQPSTPHPSALNNSRTAGKGNPTTFV